MILKRTCFSLLKGALCYLGWEMIGLAFLVLMC